MKSSDYQSNANKQNFWIVFGILGILVLAVFIWTIFFTPPDKADKLVEIEPTRKVVTPSPTPSATPTTTSTTRSGVLTFLEPTNTPTSVPGGQLLILTPQAADVGWVVSDDTSSSTNNFAPKNHFGDSYLYAGVLDRKIYFAAFQFDLSSIPRGTEIYGAGLNLTGLRVVQTNEPRDGIWRLHLLTSDLDAHWRAASYQQIQYAAPQITFEPALTWKQLGEDRVNYFEFSPEQLHLLERHLLDSSDQLGAKISFRLDGPVAGGNNLFAWDSGYGPASKGAGPELFLNLGPTPQATPPLRLVVITSTPTPENITTAAANSLRMTAEATRIGTATPLPPQWVTPFVVTATPTAQNKVTAQVMDEVATAVALTTGQPPNVVTATPTPTYMIITSTPTPQNVMTAAAEAGQAGLSTSLPPNWVTPVVVTSVPTPANTATAEYLAAVALTTGTPTATPGNVQTATPTSVFVVVESLASPTFTATPSATPQPIPTVLLGKIVFLSDREGSTEEERQWADRVKVTPQVVPQPYIFDPETGQLGRLTDIWPYDVAVTRDAWSADTAFETYTKQLLWTNVGGHSTEELAIHYYDYVYNTEQIITRMGAGIAYDPVWSPISNEIAFVATESGNDEIWVINHDGSNPRQLTRNEWEWDKHPSWSPDGQEIVFVSNRTGKNQLWIMNKDGGEQRLLMDWNPYNDWDPVWIKYLEPAPPLEQKPDWRFIKPPEETQASK